MPTKGKSKRKPSKATIIKNRQDARYDHDVKTIREYLVEISEGDRHGEALDKASQKFNIDAKSLAKFRDGQNAALPATVVTLLATAMGREGDLMGTYFDPDLGKLVDDGDKLVHALIERNSDDAKLRYFDRIERDRPEVRSAMDAWADMATSGAVGTSIDEIPLFEPKVVGSTVRGQRFQSVLNDLHDKVSTRLLPWEKKWMICRGMSQYGREWGEIALKQTESGQFEVDEICPRHVRTMRVNRKPDGKIDFNQYYEQFDPCTNKQYTTFPFWKILHFARGTRWCQDEGEGVLDGLVSTNIKLSALENAMLIRRVENSARERVFLHDTTGMDSDATRKYIDDQKRSNKRLKTIDRNAKTDVLQIAQPTGTDHHVPSKKDSANDVKVLQSDPNIDKIDDFKHLHATFRAGLGPPNAHLNYEGDTMKSVVTDLHIVFARKVRRLQINYLAQEKKLYDLMLILRRIDPRSQKYIILPPTLGTRDDLIQAQVANTYASVVRNLATAFSLTGEVPTIEWFLRTFMNLTDEEYESLELAPVVAPIKTDAESPEKLGQGNNSKPGESISNDDIRTGAEMRTAIQVAKRRGESWANDATECVSGLKFLLAERAIAKNQFEIAEKYDAGAKRAFSALIGESEIVKYLPVVCSQLGISYLWDA